MRARPSFPRRSLLLPLILVVGALLPGVASPLPPLFEAGFLSIPIGAGNRSLVIADFNHDGFESAGRQTSSIPASSVRQELLWVAPSPARHGSTIGFTLTSPAEIELSIFDVSGRRIVDLDRGRRQAGTHEIAWPLHSASGEHVRPGVYFAALRMGQERRVRRIVVLE